MKQIEKADDHKGHRPEKDAFGREIDVERSAKRGESGPIYLKDGRQAGYRMKYSVMD